MTNTTEIRAAANRIQSRAPRRAELVKTLDVDRARVVRLQEEGEVELAAIDAADAADGRVLASTGAIIDGSRPERLLYRTIRNLVTNEWGLDKTTFAQYVTDTILKPAEFHAPTLVSKWLEGPSFRALVHQVTRETVKNLVEATLKTEVRAEIRDYLARRIQLSATVVPDDKVKG
jgi:hypothetical protein